MLASDWLAGRLSACQERERERERDGWNDAEIALPCVAIHWCVACPFTCVLLASPPVRIDAGMLVCSLASLCLQRQESEVIEREREREKGILVVYGSVAWWLAICLASWLDKWPNSWVAGRPATWLLIAWLSGMPLCMHACLPARLAGLMRGRLRKLARGVAELERWRAGRLDGSKQLGCLGCLFACMRVCLLACPA